MRSRSRILVLAVLALLASAALVSPGHAAGLPSRAKWLSDVRHDMVGSIGYLDRRTSGAHGRLAINLDIDNTSLATKYGGGAVGPVLRFAKRAHAEGVAVFFNTGRNGAKLRMARGQLTRAGFPVDRVCGLRSATVSLVQSKKRCRKRFVARGYTIIANVGNSATDFAGGNYQRAFRLPSYGGRLK
ncbi:MAG: hypothetical protein FWE71_10490 [Nocardioidaceae bacterium]|nr:hypothetical protein [Nocardioidaceae bacterium]MCL2614371.1 hypothetical protein [Nocardioidaceae bacterium]